MNTESFRNFAKVSYLWELGFESKQKILLFSNLKKPACASKQKMFELETLRYLIRSNKF